MRRHLFGLALLMAALTAPASARRQGDGRREADWHLGFDFGGIRGEVRSGSQKARLLSSSPRAARWLSNRRGKRTPKALSR